MNKKLIFLSPLFVIASSLQAAEVNDADWKQNNQIVSEFTRGHADVLKWEQANPQATSPALSESGIQVKKPVLKIESINQAIKLAWKPHADMVKPLAQLGSENTERLANGQWLALSPQKIRRIPEIDEVLDIAYSARKTMLTAMAVEQTLPLQQDVLQADEASAELSSRLAKVGNWSQYQNAQQQLVLLSAQQQWRRSQYGVQQSRASVLKSFQLWNTSAQPIVVLPSALPALPAAPLSESDLMVRLNSFDSTLPMAELVVLQANAELVYSAYRTAYQLAKDSEQQLKLRQFIYDETVLRYNGMLMHTLELLAASKERMLAQIESVNALRDFWLAETDLQMLMMGYTPMTLVSLAPGNSETPSAASH